MKTSSLLALSLLVLMALSANAQTVQPILIPANTVIPVVLDTPLSSATAKVGDTFVSHCAQPNCAGFPAGTTFVGQVVSVTHYTSSVPGQIEVRFVQANLPDGTKVSIDGGLTSLYENTVVTDRATGHMMARSTDSVDRNRFIAYGAGAGALIGALTGGNILTGGLIGAGAGWLAGSLIKQPESYREVVVPSGTQYGIQLYQPVRFGPPSGSGPVIEQDGICLPPSPSGAGPQLMPIDVPLSTQQPFTNANGVLMVPFQAVMQGVDQQFSYDSVACCIALDSSQGRIQHAIGSNIVYVNGNPVALSAPSQMIGGTLYVPVDFITTTTGRSANWLPDTHTFRIQ